MRDEAEVSALDALALGLGAALALLTGSSLLLAELGHHSALGAAALTLVCLVALGAVGRRRVRVERGPLLATLGVLAVGAVLTVPGFSYAVADKDPGGYVTHAVEIARHGGVSFTDPVLAAGLPVVRTSPGARFTGVWIRDAATGEIVPQFVHGQQSLLATGFDAGGWLGLRLVTPLCGLVALVGACALGRRASVAVLGPAAATVGTLAPGLLLATCSLQVWQARTPGSEVLAEALWLTALLGVAVTVRTRWLGAALVGGFALGAGFWVRVDAVLGLLLGVGLAAALVATGRADRRLAWGAAAAAVTLPLGVVQAYVVARDYTRVNAVPGPWLLAGISAVVLLAALVLRRTSLGRRLDGLLDARRAQLATVLCALLLLALALLATRRWWLGRDLHPDGRGGIVRSFNEVNLVRLSWSLTWAGLGLAVLGALLVLRSPRWRAAAWVVLLPTATLAAVYLWDARNAPPLMFWARRYVPTVLAGLLLLTGLAVAWLWLRRRSLAVLALALVLGWALPASAAFRAHDEWAGSWELGERIAASAGQPSVFLWETGHGSRGVDVLFATPVWLEHGQLSAALPGPTRGRDAYAARFASTLGRAVLVVTPGHAVPAGMDPRHLSPVLAVDTSLPVWEETLTTRPTHSERVPVVLTVWRWSP